MSAPPTISFRIDEQLPVRQCQDLLGARGHLVTPVQIAAPDDAILLAADTAGAVVLTADRWYLAELYRLPSGHRRAYTEAGVVQLPGEWRRARPRLRDYLPLIEWVYTLRQGQRDHRVGIDLAPRASVRIIDTAR